MDQNFKRLITRFVVFYPLVFSCLTFIPTLWWPLEINISGSPYYLIVHILGFAWFLSVLRLYSRSVKVFTLLLLTLLCFKYAAPLKNFYFYPAVATDGQSIKAFVANVYRAGGNKEKLKAVILKADPDLVGLIEVDQDWISQLKLMDRYKYRVELPQDDNFGIAFYSRYPILSADTSIGEDLPPVIIT